MKKIFVIVMIWLALLSVTYAANDTGDCLLTNDLSKRNENYENSTTPGLLGSIINEGSIMSGIIAAMPKKAMEKAFDNLNRYCCKTKVISNDFCTAPNDNTPYPESEFIFDHILDVYLRRLDAKEENDNWENLLYGLDADWSGLEWRQYITECGNDVNGTRPLDIKTQYDIFWTWTKDVPSLSNNYEEMKGARNFLIALDLTLHDSWTLREKYNLACDVANYITENILNSKNWLTSEQYTLCKKLTNSRIERETVYVQTLLMQKANKLLGSNMNSYLNSYFIQNKLSNLEKIIFDINTSFSEVNKGVTKLTPQCS